MSRKTATRLHRDWFYIALFLGLVLLGAAGYTSRQLTIKYNSIQSVVGTTVGTAPNGLVLGVEFTATDGKTYEVPSELFGQYRVGEKETVYYPRVSPGEAQTEPFERTYKFPKFLLVVGLLCTGFGARGLAKPGYNYVVEFAKRRRQRRKVLRSTKKSKIHRPEETDEIRDSEILEPRPPFERKSKP